MTDVQTVATCTAESVISQASSYPVPNPTVIEVGYKLVLMRDSADSPSLIISNLLMKYTLLPVVNHWWRFFNQDHVHIAPCRQKPGQVFWDSWPDGGVRVGVVEAWQPNGW